jgi:hypothetical protein
MDPFTRKEAYGHAELCYPEWFTKAPVFIDYSLDTFKIHGICMYGNYIRLVLECWVIEKSLIVSAGRSYVSAYS